MGCCNICLALLGGCLLFNFVPVTAAFFPLSNFEWHLEFRALDLWILHFISLRFCFLVYDDDGIVIYRRYGNPRRPGICNLLIAKKGKPYVTPFDLQTLMYYGVLATPKYDPALYPLAVNARSLSLSILT